MKKKIRLKTLLFLPLLVSGISAKDNYKKVSHEEMNVCCSSLNENKIDVINGEHAFKNNFEYFNLLSNFEADKINCTGDAKLSDYSISGNNIRCLITNIDNLDKVILSFIKDEIVVFRQALYFAKSCDGTYYSSDIALDNAMILAGQTLNYSLYREDEDKEKNKIYPINPTNVGVVGSVSGSLKWKDDQGNIHPVVEAKVRVTINGSWWSAETYTNKDGFYKIEYNDIWYLGSGCPTVHILTENQNVKVHNGGTYEHSYEFNGSSGDWKYDYVFSPDNDNLFGEAMMIFQGAKNFADYAEYLNGGNSVEFCNFQYPYDKVDSADYDRNGTVRIKNITPLNDSCPKAYASWDTIGHEYAHHLQKVFKIANNPGGRHIINSNNIDDQYIKNKSLEQAKENGQKLSWAEGWASYWSIVAQSHFDEDLKSIATVGDTWYISTNGVKEDLNCYDTSSRGDASELAIQRFLYKLYSKNTDTYDKFALNDLKIWNIIVKNKPLTFSSFINNLYSDGLDKNNLGLLLGKYNVISNAIRVSNNNLTYTWSTYMGSKYLRFNKYDLFFEDLNGNILVEKNNIITSSDTCEVTLNENEWNKIKSNSSSKYIMYYIAWQTTGNLSGGYYSKKITKYI